MSVVRIWRNVRPNQGLHCEGRLLGRVTRSESAVHWFPLSVTFFGTQNTVMSLSQQACSEADLAIPELF